MTYSTDQVLPHLVDHLHHLPQGAVIGYVGCNQTLLHFLKDHFSVTTLEECSSIQSLHKASTLILFDFGFDASLFSLAKVNPSHPDYPSMRKKLKRVLDHFLTIASIERKQIHQKKLIGINVHDSDYLAPFHCYLHLLRTTRFSGIMVGYAKKTQPFSLITSKRERKFLLLYLLLRFFYHQTDRIRYLAYKLPFVKKYVQHK